jgi:hypothetical protein
VSQETYVVLIKDSTGVYWPSTKVKGREQAKALVSRLIAEKPGTYALLNLETNTLEDIGQK